MAVEVGVTELRENLAHWIDRAANGEDVIVTDRGKPRIRMSGIDAVLQRLVEEGRLIPPKGPPVPVPRLNMEGSLMPHLWWARGKVWPEDAYGYDPVTGEKLPDPGPSS